PHGQTSKEIDQLQSLAPTIMDLSADFRLRDRAGYPTWYGWEHPQPALLNDFVYALPELHREQIRPADRLAADRDRREDRIIRGGRGVGAGVAPPPPQRRDAVIRSHRASAHGRDHPGARSSVAQRPWAQDRLLGDGRGGGPWHPGHGPCVPQRGPLRERSLEDLPCGLRR